jgi:glyoxylase I family protein
MGKIKMIKRLHHTAIIVSSEAGVDFYKELGFEEENRVDRGYDQIVWMTGYGETIEIFIDPTHPERVTNPEAMGLRHLAFEVDDVAAEWERLKSFNPEPIRTKDDGKKVFFVKDPDGLPIEIRD